MSCRNAILNTIARQYNEKWRFPDYDRAIKKLQCHHVHSFLSCTPQNFDGIFHDYDVPVYVCKFCPSKLYSHILAVANENGTVCIENIKNTRVKTYVQTHNNTVFDLCWMPGEMRFITVSGDHSAKLWDYGENDIKMVSEFLGHTRSVKCIHFKPENTSVFATGSRDGSLIIWDARCSRRCSRLPGTHIPDQVIPSAAGTLPFVPKRKYYPVEASQSNSVTGLVFQNDNTLISTGSSDQCVRVWDMRKTYSRSATLPLPKYQLMAPSPGFSNICIDPTGSKIYANSMDSYIYCFNANSYNPDPISAFYGHQNGSFYVKSSLSHDGWYLLSGSTDKFAYIWNTRKAELSEEAIKPIVALPGHTAEVACIAMSPDGDMKVATCSDDGTYRLWFTYSSRRMRDPEDTIDTADVFDEDNTISVRTQWRNKRKRSFSDDDTKDIPCAFHTKICRYYSKGLSNIRCTCQRNVNRMLLYKRPLNAGSDDSRTVKRPSLLEPQESTSAQYDEMKIENPISIQDANFPKKSTSTKKITLKRKLSEMPYFMDECESKRKADEKISPAVDHLKTNKCKTEVEGAEVVSGAEGAQRDDVGNSSHVEHDDPKDREKYSNESEVSSPTSNLPNYVKDGTSPYIHRCPRTQKENVDWLTKLRKSSVKKPDADKAEVPECSYRASKNDAKLQLIGLKRKFVRSNSTEGKSSTLHKYFKISSRSADMSCAPQDMPKKPC